MAVEPVTLVLMGLVGSALVTLGGLAGARMGARAAESAVYVQFQARLQQEISRLDDRLEEGRREQERLRERCRALEEEEHACQSMRDHVVTENEQLRGRLEIVEAELAEIKAALQRHGLQWRGQNGEIIKLDP